MRRVTRPALILLAFGAMLLPGAAQAQTTAPPPAAAPARTFGAYVDPWNLAPWRQAGIGPQYVARFEAFSRGATVHAFIREAEAQGLGSVLVSWEPWRPVPPELGVEAQFASQAGYRNVDIAAGAQDDYILAFARDLATYPGTVYLRYAHEMNGTWYPWSRDPIAYRRAWRHVVRLFESAGAHNVRFVWSVNPSLFLPAKDWLRSVRVYWPGRRYVDVLGSTMINFGGKKAYPVKRFEPRLSRLHKLYRRPLMLTEVKTARAGRVRWLRDLRAMLRRRSWIRSVTWFQSRSRAAVQLDDVGAGSWDLTRDAAAARVVRGIIRDGRR
jgi:mannan endo-1,4-beta-mannosidase